MLESSACNLYGREGFFPLLAHGVLLSLLSSFENENCAVVENDSPQLMLL